MIQPHTVIVCPSCRVFVDRVGAMFVPGEIVIRCPWCLASATAAEYAEAGTRDLCGACAHPACAHVNWYTSDGSPPHPLTRSSARAVDAPCILCAHEGRADCTLSAGALEVAS